MVTVHRNTEELAHSPAVSVQQWRRCAKEACPLYIGYAEQADDKADSVLLTLTMNERLQQKLGRISGYLGLIRQLQPDCEARFEADALYRGALLHYLYLMADSCVAVAEMVIRFKSLRPPQTYHEAFDILGEAGVLDAVFAYRFAAIAGFRNFLAHDYEGVDGARICGQILASLKDVDEFLRQIQAAV